MIAMALALEPKLLIADEPTTALDVTIQAQVLELLQRLTNDQGTAVILITHDLGVVAGMTRRINVMYAGYVVEAATTADLFERPRHPYTVGLLHSIPRLDAVEDEPLIPIEGVPPDLRIAPVGCPFAPRCAWRLPQCWTEMPPLSPLEPGPRGADDRSRRDAPHRLLEPGDGRGSDGRRAAPARLPACTPAGRQARGRRRAGIPRCSAGSETSVTWIPWMPRRSFRVRTDSRTRRSRGTSDDRARPGPGRSGAHRTAPHRSSR